MKTEISPIQLAQRGKINLSFIYQLIYAGRIKARRQGGRWRISDAEAEKFLGERKARLGGQAGDNGPRD